MHSDDQGYRGQFGCRLCDCSRKRHRVSGVEADRRTNILVIGKGEKDVEGDGGRLHKQQVKAKPGEDHLRGSEARLVDNRVFVGL